LLKKFLSYRSMKQWLPAPLLLREMAWRYWIHGEPEIRFLRELIRPGTNSVDVGAASGLYSYHMARLSRSVYAFEPNPQWATWLPRAVPRNVIVFDVALSNKSGTAVLSIPPPSLESMVGDLSLRCAEAASIEKHFAGVPCDRVPILTKRLDDYQFDNLSFIKIDVEGHEAAVLEGAEETLRRYRPALLVEIEHEHIKRDIRAEFAQIEALGYQGWFCLNRELRRLEDFDLQKYQPPVALELRSRPFINNFIFKPRKAAHTTFSLTRTIE
jgi:FkbM family methyltransferase